MKKSKYGNIKTDAFGKKFDSKKEARRYGELLLLLKAGEISELETQKRFEMSLLSEEYKFEKFFAYVADFVYKDKDGTFVVEDVKSEITRKNPVYRLKKKALKIVYGITIKET